MAGLIVRNAERHEISLPVRMRVAGEHVSVVRLAAGAPTRDGWIEADLADLSRSGFGLVSPVFLPRLTLIQVQILDPVHGDEADPLLDGLVRIRRVIMTDGRPSYLIGTSVEHGHSMITGQLNKLMDRCSDAAADRDEAFSGEEEAGDA